MFVAGQTEAEGEGKKPCTAGPAEVEAFMTVAGRHGKKGSLTTRVSIDDVERALPVTYLGGLLPGDFADHLLRTFLEEGKRWRTSKRWLYDREIESHRLESGFRFDAHGRPGGGQGFGRRWEAAGFGDDLRHLRGMVAAAVQRSRATLRRAWRAGRASGAAGAAAEGGGEAPSRQELVQETVALASRGQRLNPASVEWLMRYACEFAQRSWRWEPNYCVANLYKDEGDFLGAHSDPVESIGPWAVVASFTLGAARQFRMKPVGTIRVRAEGGGRVTSYSVRLPHNSLLICWEGFQEFWRHEVPKDAQLARHPISGSTRLNFTFRRSDGQVARRRPLCHCGRKAHLKPVLKEASRHRGRYFWSCANPRVKKGVYQTCDFFRWDDEVVAEALARQAQPAGGAPPSRPEEAGAAGGGQRLGPDAGRSESLGSSWVGAALAPPESRPRLLPQPTASMPQVTPASAAQGTPPGVPPASEFGLRLL